MANKTFARIPAHAWKMLLLSSVISGLAGSASAETFDIKGTVQKAVALTKVTDLNFGTLFTTSPDTTGAAAANSSTLVMSPTGTVVTATGGATAPPLVQMAAGTPGSYSSAALPAGSVVWIRLAHPDDPETTLDPATANATTCAYSTASAAVAAGRIVLSQGDFSGFFCVDSFTSDRTGLLDDGTKFSIGALTALTFKVGATLITQADAAAPTYLEGAYTGQYIMEINF